MTKEAPIDNLFFEIDALVERLEEVGYDISDIVDVMSQYVEVVTEYL
ncbi:hypothetical protein S-CBP2_0018 [Synechococcus phage S-CBP2]|uniref:Uncharacterized protein n=1 Tax=Synechococcus phage S-CBP2 TaxID=756277 RepID=A0A096VKY3_9CAUD|nr:hypothetical protein S-CBP2_0018 [Synechococcus phage S-CBP2]AGK86724.1 hypothetical protein S-CBP2_0018 [Synechococcus phage S-CBP2]